MTTSGRGRNTPNRTVKKSGSRSKRTKSGASGPTPGAGERRRNPSLREVLDELIEHVRAVAQRAGEMTPDELAYAQERLEWLGDEVWELAMRGGQDSDG